MMAHIEGYYRPGDEAQDEATGAPLQPYSDRMAEDHYQHGRHDQREDPGMGAEALHHVDRWIVFWYTTWSLGATHLHRTGPRQA